ncbi:zinc finger FYVE domain-containing protein 16 [Osmerus mordax]|uniref:zinc finger FYVE domain-containing protein 16 n=1 Tax=Osmerus mordax TaxID=8014 RepID=UPI00350F96E3
MDSFFKAAVCDLDKLLDDFELNTEDIDCKSVSLMSPAYPFSSLSSQCFPSAPPTIPQALPDLNTLHYGCAPTCPDSSCPDPAPGNSPSPGECEAKGRPLTGVDLLSSVDGRTAGAKISAPPCPDRSLKPVCDLVSDTGSANLIRANSHNVFGELDLAERQLEEDGELLVDFDSPALTLPAEEVVGQGFGPGRRESEGTENAARKEGFLDMGPRETMVGYSFSLSLLDVILPATAERASEPSPSRSQSADRQDEDEEVAQINQLLHDSPDHLDQSGVSSLSTSTQKEDTPTSDLLPEACETEVGSKEYPKLTEAQDLQDPAPFSPSAEREPMGLSCLPMAVSMCGALVTLKNPEEEVERPSGDGTETELAESLEAESLPASEVIEDIPAEWVNAVDSPSPGATSDNPVPRPENLEVDLVPMCQGDLAPLVSQPTLEVSVSPVKEELPPGASAPSCPHSPPSEASPGDPPEFGFEYLPESDQAGLLVTDEELDAFLQGQGRMVAGEGISHCGRSSEWAQDEGFSELNGDLEDRLVEEELRSCSQGPGERLENLASPESDRVLLGEENLTQVASAPSQDPPTPDRAELTVHDVSNSHPQPSLSPDSQPCYGGARPKQLPCQAPRSPPAAGEGEDLHGPSSLTDNQSIVQDWGESHPSPPSPNPAEEASSTTDPGSVYSPQEHYESRVGYDELSEPPPYPGELPGEGTRAGDEREAEGLGCRQPPWLPDSEAPNCMNCSQRFTFTKRRHHCRACGKVYCAVCCNRRCRLKYLDKEARVCVLCYETIHKTQALERMMSPTGSSPNPNVPSEYCSTIPPLQQARAAGTLNSPPPTVMVPVSVLKHPSNDGCPREQKHVWFADGILPNGEVADTTKLSVMGRRCSQESSPITPDPPMVGSSGSEADVAGGAPPSEALGPAEVLRPPVSGPWDYALLCGVGEYIQRCPSLLPDDEEGLPPLLITTGETDSGDLLVEERPAPCQILLLLEEGGPRPLTFVLNANLLVNVKLVTYCSRRCWCFGSSGLQALGQREMVFVLECLPEERAVPKDLFTLYLNIYQDAQKGKFVEELGNVTFTVSFLGSKEHGGILFFSPSCQPLEGLCLPPQPFLCGLLIQRLEVPWAKVFPLRLLLRLGAEHHVYPSTLVSIRFRESVYRETGHTIMNLLADLRNYQYSLPAVEGLRIHMEMGHSYIDIPKSRFSQMLKVVNASNEHVISVGATLSSEADSHLVCFQNEEGNYQTQANSMPGKTRTVTGASFVVFNGALKASSGFIAKSSIVEDGLMVQIPPDTMEALRTALREQTDFHIPCGKTDGTEVRDKVTVRWVDWAAPVNTGVTSRVDGRSLEGIHSMRMQQETEFLSEGHAIRCTEVFYLLKTADSSLAAVLPTCSVFQREMALASCSALTPHLAVLTARGINSLSLRVSTNTDMVEYQAGSGGRLLPQRYMNELDSALIPVIHGGTASVPQIAMDIEFIFYITHCI